VPHEQRNGAILKENWKRAGSINPDRSVGNISVSFNPPQPRGIKGVKSPKNNSGCINRLLQAKLSYYPHYRTDFNQILYSDRDQSTNTFPGWSKYAPNKSQMAEGRHLEHVYLLTPMDHVTLLHVKSTRLHCPPKYNYQTTNVGR